MNQKAKILFPFFLLSLLLVVTFIPTTNAFTFNENGESGYWNDATYPHFAYDTAGQVQSGNTNLTITPSATITNITGGLVYSLNVHHITGNRAEWYWLSGVMRFYYVVDCYNPNTDEHVYIWFYIAHEKGVVVDTAQILCGSTANPVVSVNNVANWDASYYAPTILTNDNEYKVILTKNSDTSASVNYQASNTTVARLWVGGGTDVEGNSFYTEDYTVSADFWNNFQMRLFVGYEGVGSFDMTFGEMYIDENSPHLDEQWETQPNTNPFVNFLGSLWQYFGIFGDVAYLFISLARVLIDNSPVLLFMFAISMGITCMVQMSIEPLRQFAEFIWNLAHGVINVLTGIVGAIKDIIQWW